jgi:hypothetical protein
MMMRSCAWLWTTVSMLVTLSTTVVVNAIPFQMMVNQRGSECLYEQLNEG